MLPPYRNEPFGDFSSSERRATMQRALRHVSGQFGASYPLVIGGEHIMREERLESINPCEPKKVVGYVSKADQDLANQAVLAAEAAFQTWRRVPVEARAQVVLRAAAIMRRNKEELAAWMIFEVGKTWVEADADTAEAIDFCEFYAREALRSAATSPSRHIPGETHELRYIPLGVGVVIPPWNFPLAILTGMTVAADRDRQHGRAQALPARPGDRRVRLVEILEAAGLPPGVVNFVAGAERSLGDYLVEHPKTRFIAFTGSKDVGLRIHEPRPRCASRARSGSSAPSWRWAARTAIIVDETADLDAAAEGIVAGGLRLPGPEVLGLLARDHRRRRSTTLCSSGSSSGRASCAWATPRSPRRASAAVIDRRAFDSISELHRDRQEGGPAGRRRRGGRPDRSRTAATSSSRPCSPTSAPGRGISQEEIFGPVLAVIKAKDFDDALGDRQRHRVRPDRRRLLPDIAPPRARPRGVPRRQPLPQPQVHRRARRRPPLRRLQHVRHRQQGRRPRLPAALHPGQVDRREAVALASLGPGASPSTWGIQARGAGLAGAPRLYAPHPLWIMCTVRRLLTLSVLADGGLILFFYNTTHQTGANQIACHERKLSRRCRTTTTSLQVARGNEAARQPQDRINTF